MNFEQRKKFAAQQKELKAKIAFSNSYKPPDVEPPPEPPVDGGDGGDGGDGEDEQNPEHQPSNRFPKQSTF
jgi:hypothetical protein